MLLRSDMFIEKTTQNISNTETSGNAEVISILTVCKKGMCYYFREQ